MHSIPAQAHSEVDSRCCDFDEAIAGTYWHTACPWISSLPIIAEAEARARYLADCGRRAAVL